MRQRRRLRAGRRAHVVRLGVRFAGSHGCIANALLACLVGGVVKQGTNIVHEERVKQLRDVLFVREIQRAIEGYPVSCK